MRRALLIAGPPFAIVVGFAVLASADFKAWGWALCLVVGSLMTAVARFALGPRD